MNPPLDQLKRRVEETIGHALTRLMKQQVGRGPEDLIVYLVDDMILLRLKKVLTPAEAQVAATPEGRRLVKEFRLTLLEAWGASLWSLVKQTTGAQVVCIHSDLDTAADHLVIIIVLDRKIAALPDDAPEGDPSGV
jgi:uncharacterized protein YbcI